MVLEARIVLIMDSLELADMQIPLALELLQLGEQIDLLLLERRLAQPKYLVLFVPLLKSHAGL